MARRGRVALGAMALLAVAPSAQAFELTTTDGGTPLSWDTTTIRYAVAEAPPSDPLATATRAAFDTWAFASRGGLQPAYLAPRAVADPDDGVCTVSLDAVWDPSFGEVERALAFAWVQYDPVTGRIREGDVHLNGERFGFSDAVGAFDPESVVLHEVGHVLGLAHSCGLPGRTYPSCFSVPDEPEGNRDRVLEAVMAPTLSPSTVRRRPNLDDIEGLRTNFDGEQDARPRISGLFRSCPDGAWIVTLEAPWPGGLEAGLRYADGDWTARTVTVDGATLRLEGEAPPPGVVDLVVRDPDTHVYDAWVDVSVPEPCVAMNPEPTPNPPTAAEGCRCVVDPPTGSGRAWSALVMLMGVLVTMRTRRRTVLGLLTAAAVSIPSSGWAFECSRTGSTVGPSLIWSAREVPWYAGRGVFEVVGDAEQGKAEVLASFTAWEAPDCSDLFFPFQGEADVTAGFDEGQENRNVVVVVDRLWPYQNGAIAVTTTAYDTRTGRVVDADIELNTATFRFEHVVDGETNCAGRDNLMDLRNTLTHEVGHVLGLEHPPNTARYAETTMFASAPACETRKRTLAQDDIDGLCFIYPAGAETQQCYPPDGPSFIVVETDDGFGGCRSTPGDAAGLWGLVAGGLLLARRARRRN